jgi:glycosyltransferase involved in cell wall biosynthesis
MANATPKVSIIVASYNNQETIGECLKSILAQNYPPDAFEVIVMDGGSKDNTIKIAEQFPIKVVSLPLNCPAAYNYALKIAAYPTLDSLTQTPK